MSIRDILNWQPSKKENAEIYKTSVPLSERKIGHKINPLANEEAKVQSLAYMGSNSDQYSAVGTEKEVFERYNPYEVYGKQGKHYLEYDPSDDGITIDDDTELPDDLFDHLFE